jgi:hypothetical protein
VKRDIEPDVRALGLDRSPQEGPDLLVEALQILETSDREIPSMPSARTNSSTLRVDTPFT